MKLAINGIIKFLLGVIMVSLLLFIPAGTLAFWNAWVFMGLLFIPMIFVGIWLFIKKPELLAKRLNGNEKEKTQKFVILFSVIIFVAGFVICGLDFKNKWTNSNALSTIMGSIVLLLSYILYVEVLKENAYLSRNVEIQKEQKLINTGMYRIVRHPMYLATTTLFLSFPIVLGSLYGFLVFLFYPIILMIRIINEEKILEEGLEGYKDYKDNVKYRMIPFIW